MTKKKDSEIKRIEQGTAWDDSDEVVEIRASKQLDKVVPVRLPSDIWEKLRYEAKELGIGPTTLARMWIIERLRLRTSTEITLLNIVEALKQDTTIRNLLGSEPRNAYKNE